MFKLPGQCAKHLPPSQFFLVSDVHSNVYLDMLTSECLMAILKDSSMQWGDKTRVFGGFFFAHFPSQTILVIVPREVFCFFKLHRQFSYYSFVFFCSCAAEQLEVKAF